MRAGRGALYVLDFGILVVCIVFEVLSQDEAASATRIARLARLVRVFGGGGGENNDPSLKAPRPVSKFDW